MKNTLAFMILGLLTTNAQADQAATFKCVGSKVQLETRAPYLGENSKFQQELFILKAIDAEGESERTAYFLNVEIDITGARHGGAGRLLYTGLNEVKGKFEMNISPWNDVSDEVSVKKEASGTIKYSHGPLKGQDSVTCTME